MLKKAEQKINSLKASPLIPSGGGVKGAEGKVAKEKARNVGKAKDTKF